VIWTAGVIGFHADLPVTFPYKFFGCLFDAVIAAAVFDYRGKRAAWLYALAPVPIIIVAIHGQWESISIALFILALLVLRRPGVVPAIWAGSLYVLAVIAKPIVIPFVVFLFPAPWRLRDRGERHRADGVVGGMIVTVALYLLVMRAIGDPITDRIIFWVLDYARVGVTYLGLPHALGIARQNRLLLLLPIAVLLPLYWKGRIEREDAVTLSYAFILGTCGLGAQYLFWLVPFLLMRGHERFAAVYTLVAGLYLVLFYTSVAAPYPNDENVGALAPLRIASWLTPGGTDAAIKTEIIRPLGSIVLPLACLVFVLFTIWRRRTPIEAVPSASVFLPMVVAIGITIALFGFSLMLPTPKEEEFLARTRARILATYDVVPTVAPSTRRGELAWAVPPVAHRFDVTWLAYLWIAAWSGAAYLTGVRARQ